MRSLILAAAFLVAASGPAFAQSFSKPYVTRPIGPPEFNLAYSPQGVTMVHAAGSNSDCDSSEEAVWAGGSTYNFLSTADELRVKVGGDANDIYSGSGAREIVVVGLDSSFDEISESISLMGAAVSAKTTQQFLRLNKAYVNFSGTYGAANTGVINIETEAGTLVGVIPAKAGVTDQAVYTVPNGYVAYVVAINGAVGPISAIGTAKGGRVLLKKNPSAFDFATPWPYGGEVVMDITGSMTNSFQITEKTPMKVNAQNDLWLACVGGTDMYVAGSMDIYLTASTMATPTPVAATPIPSPTPTQTP